MKSIDLSVNKEILNTERVKEYILSLHKKYVICPIDKAGKNFGIVCKKFYIEALKKELGITDRIIGNSVYKPVSESIDEIIEKHVAQLKSDFNINIPEIDRSIPYLYWISKQHKNPYKFRFIVVPHIVLLNYCLLNLLRP